MTVAEARDVYVRGTVPAMTALDGAPKGRMLSVAGIDRGAIARRLRAFAASKSFPWGGKSFRASSDDAGAGVNRVELLGQREWFPFDTRVGPSAIDGEPAIILDYDKPENPWFIRKIHDELREVSENLYLGPAMWKTAGDPRFVLWFAIDKQ
jgi:hypothetical protein